MVHIHWMLVNFLTILGFVLALLFLVQILREQRRSPSSVMAWLLAIFLVPYIGVPLYIIFGGRKMQRMTMKKPGLFNHSQNISGANHAHREPVSRLVSSGFPRREYNHVTVLPTGADAFRTLIQTIEHARQSIYITTFIFGNDVTGQAILNALTRKAREGVEVCLLLDALGSWKISERILAKFQAAGGKYAFFMPMIHIPFRGRANLRNHRKIVLIDQTLAIVGGMNLAQEYMGAINHAQQWHDLSIMAEGPIVSDLDTVFRSDWTFAAKEALRVRPEQPIVAEYDDPVALQVVPSGPDVAGDPMYDTIVTALFSAQQRIWIVTPYFIPDDVLVKALCIAARRHVDVRIVIPLVSNHRLADFIRQSYVRQIQDAGAKIFQLTPGMVHGKVILIDDSFGIIGSMNMDMRSFFLDYEIALFIESKEAIPLLDCWVRGVMAHCTIGVKAVSGMVEFFEGIGRLFAPLL
jgi:cardiolipin synthase A/B